MGIIDDYSKDFRLNLKLERNQETLKSYLTHYAEPGNTIVIDGWSGYDFLSNTGDYHHNIHLHEVTVFKYIYLSHGATAKGKAK